MEQSAKLRNILKNIGQHAVRGSEECYSEINPVDVLNDIYLDTRTALDSVEDAPDSLSTFIPRSQTKNEEWHKSMQDALDRLGKSRDKYAKEKKDNAS